MAQDNYGTCKSDVSVMFEYRACGQKVVGPHGLCQSCLNSRLKFYREQLAKMKKTTAEYKAFVEQYG